MKNTTSYKSERDETDNPDRQTEKREQHGLFVTCFPLMSLSLIKPLDQGRVLEVGVWEGLIHE